MENKNSELERVRSSFGFYFEGGNGGGWHRYRIDADAMAPVLSRYVNRDALKEKLSVLNSDFKALFNAAPLFKNTKEENKFYFQLLKSIYNKGVQPFKVDENVIRGYFEDVIYDECFEAEQSLYYAIDRLEEYKKAKESDHYYTDISKAQERVDKAGVELYKALDKEADVEVKKCIDSVDRVIHEDVGYIINLLDGFYTYENKTDAQRKQEQRLRDVLFNYIVIGFCYYYDNYLPVCLKNKDTNDYPERIKGIRTSKTILHLILNYEMLTNEDFIKKEYDREKEAQLRGLIHEIESLIYYNDYLPNYEYRMTWEEYGHIDYFSMRDLDLTYGHSPYGCAFSAYEHRIEEFERDFDDNFYRAEDEITGDYILDVFNLFYVGPTGSMIRELNAEIRKNRKKLLKSLGLTVEEYKLQAYYKTFENFNNDDSKTAAQEWSRNCNNFINNYKKRQASKDSK